MKKILLTALERVQSSTSLALRAIEREDYEDARRHLDTIAAALRTAADRIDAQRRRAA